MAHFTIDRPDRYVLSDDVRELRVSISAGRVNIVGTDGPVTIEATKVIGLPVDVDQRDGILDVRHRRSPGGGLRALFDWLTVGQRAESAISIAAPPDCRVSLDADSGPIVLSNLHESVTVRSVAGEVTLAEIHGRTHVETTSGSITAEAVTGDLETRTVAGAITIITTGGGAVHASTTSGAITLDLDSTTSDTVDLASVAGAVTVRLPHEPDLTVDMTSTSGRANCAFPDLEVVRQFGSSRLSGVLGRGSGRLRASTISGGLTLLRQRATTARHDGDDGRVVAAVGGHDSAPAERADEGDGPKTGEANTA